VFIDEELDIAETERMAFAGATILAGTKDPIERRETQVRNSQTCGIAV
jgi:hypothetical protein